MFDMFKLHLLEEITELLGISINRLHVGDELPVWPLCFSDGGSKKIENDLNLIQKICECLHTPWQQIQDGLMCFHIESLLFKDDQLRNNGLLGCEP